jgi:hypothetical protein
VQWELENLRNRIFLKPSLGVIESETMVFNSTLLNSMPHGMKNEMKTKIKQLKVKKMK